MPKGKTDPKKSDGKAAGKSGYGKFVGKDDKRGKESPHSSSLKSSEDCEDDQVKTNSTGAKIKGKKK